MKKILPFVVTAVIAIVTLPGCGKGNDIGDTVPGPPRALVEQSLKSHARSQAPGRPSAHP